MRNRLVGLVCLLLSTLPAVASDWDDAVVAFEDRRYAETLAMLAPLASPGNVGVQLLMIDTYINGRTALKDETARLEWARRSAKLGIAPAQEELAQNYLNGTGVEIDEAMAAHWFAQAADQWYPPAVYNLAVLTLYGQGVTADPDYALELLQRAADLNEPYALYVLGGMYLEGYFVEPDIDLSLNYLSRAAYFGQRRAMALMGIVLQHVPDDPNRLVKSAFHLRRARAAGCNDVDQLLAEATKKLSPEQVDALEYNLVAWQSDLQQHDIDLEPGPCLSE